ncbi:MAG: spore maturation protein [Bacteroidaceae bacterium]|nr:spore maturation protein [Bacteroidaceae bacterium]
MVLNYIWIAFFLIAAVVATVRFAFGGEVGVWDAMIGSTFDSARTAFEISLGLTGVLSLWMGIMRVGEKGGVVETLSRWLSPLFCRLFPDIPKGHPVTGQIFMNLSANMLGLDNAATPLGLKAMQSLQELNPRKDTATDAMIMFLVLNTSGMTIIPVSIMVYRAQMGAASPTDVFLPILLATMASTLVGVAVTALIQRIRLLCTPILVTLAVICSFVAAVAWAFAALPRETVNVWSTAIANLFLFAVIVAFLVAGMRRRINVYDAFIEGAKGGFEVAVTIIPFLVAILVAVGVFRASGAMDMLIDGVRWTLNTLGVNSDAVEALPTALMKPLSGGGARGMMIDAMKTHGADSFVGRLACIFQGSTDTTFYLLAVYFGCVGVTRMRHAVVCGLLSDLAGIVTAIAVAYLFFG